MLDLGRKAFSNRPVAPSATGFAGVSRFSRVKFPSGNPIGMHLNSFPTAVAVRLLRRPSMVFIQPNASSTFLRMRWLTA
jgi:hypothetical protein